MSSRISLRNIFLASLVVAVVIFAGLIWAGSEVYDFYGTMRAERYLESRGFYVVGERARDIEWSDFFRPRDRFTVHSPEPPHSIIRGPSYRYRPLFEPSDWQFIERLGTIRELSLRGKECNSPACYDCLRRNKASLDVLTFEACVLSSALGGAIGECAELTELRFLRTENDAKFVVAPLPRLTTVRYDVAPGSAANVAWLADQPALAQLRLNGAFTDEIVSVLLKCTALQEVDLGTTSVSHLGMQRLLADGHFDGLTYSHVLILEAEIEALVKSRLRRVGLQHTQVEAALTPLMECERIEHLEISRRQFERLVAADLKLSRRIKLRLDVHGLTRFRDVPVNPWSNCVELRRFDEAGNFIGERIATEEEEDG